MYQNKKTSRPSMTNPDGSFNVMVELRSGGVAADAARGFAQPLSQSAFPAGCTVDDEFEPVSMMGGTTIIRCSVKSQADIDALRRQPGVVAVWNDTPVEPMTPR